MQTELNIETDRLVLRPLALSDEDDLLEYQSDIQTVTYIPWPVRTGLPYVTYFFLLIIDCRDAQFILLYNLNSDLCPLTSDLWFSLSHAGIIPIGSQGFFSASACLRKHP